MQPEGQQSPPSTSWQFVPEAAPAVTQTPVNGQQPSQVASSDIQVSWTASEFIAYQKNAGWYVLAFLAIIVLAAITYFITRGDIVSTGSVIIIGILFVVLASRKPRVLTYQISSSGVKIGEKLYPFSQVKSFALIDEGTFQSISLMPLKRFMPSISMYFEPQDEQKILLALGAYLPQEQRKQEFVDRLMHKIRF